MSINRTRAPLAKGKYQDGKLHPGRLASRDERVSRATSVKSFFEPRYMGTIGGSRSLVAGILIFRKKTANRTTLERA